MLIISVPYERLACDLVGPLPRTKTGFKYILTAICVGTRYPYCVPLKRVDAVSVAEGLLEVLAHTGIYLRSSFQTRRHFSQVKS